MNDFSAFPGKKAYHDHNEGMTLRDYFAGQVISQCQVTVRKDHAEPDAEMVNAYAERFARTAYAIADAMLAERAK